MSERTEICEFCSREVPAGGSCNSAQAQDCDNQVGVSASGKRDDDFLGSLDHGQDEYR